MLTSIDRFARWWIDGLTDLLVGAGGRRARGRRFVVEAGEGGAFPVGEDGRPVGRIVLGPSGAALDPPALAGRLGGGTVEVRLPAGWMFRRPLDPVAAESAPYLDAFARHQVERVTPWRTQDAYVGVTAAPLAGDPARLTVELGAVPRSLAGPLVDALAALAPRRLSLVGPGDDGFAIRVGGSDDGGRRGLRRLVGAVLALLVVGATAAIVAGSWMQEFYETDIAEIDRLIAERKDLLRTAVERSRPKSDPAEGLRAARAATPPVVLLLDELAAALPDQAHLSELRIAGGEIRMSGRAADVSALIPALEASPRFRSVSFYAPSTRLPSGGGDRFHIEMRVEPIRQAEAAR